MKDMLQSLLENRERLKEELERNEALIRLITRERKPYTMSAAALAARKRGLAKIKEKREETSVTTISLSSSDPVE